MVAQTAYLNVHDPVAGVNAAVNYGPVPIGAGFTITRIRVRGGISFSPAFNPAPFVFINFLQHGIQHVASGGTPVNAEGLATWGTGWFKSEAIRPSQGAVTYNISATTSAFSERYNIELDWRGQFLTPNGTDVYYSVGRIYNASTNYNFHGGISVEYG